MEGVTTSDMDRQRVCSCKMPAVFCVLWGTKLLNGRRMEHRAREYQRVVGGTCY